MAEKWKFCSQTSNEDLREVRYAMYSLVKEREISYALFLQKMDIQAIEGDVMMVCHPQADGNFILGLNLEHFKKLSKTGKQELLKHVALHIPFGHKSQRGRQLVADYGPDLAELAQDMVINQQINVDVLAAKDGINLPIPEHYGMKRNLTTTGYAVLLQEMAKQQPDALPTPGGMALPRPIQMPDQSSNKHGLPTDGNGYTKLDPSDTSDPKEQMGKDLDNATKKMLDDVDSTMRSQTNGEQDMKKQGWYAGECEEFIASLDREAKISWATYLRRKEGKHRRIHRKITRRRPSRRIDEYFGRIRKLGVSCLVVVDTSGSMGSKELRCVQAEVKAMSQRRVQVLVAYVDTVVAKGPFEFKAGMQLENFAGRGGTDFRPAFKLYKSMPATPDFMVYVTDGYGTAPPDGDDVDILWVLTSSGMTEEDFKHSVCNYGDVAILDVDES